MTAALEGPENVTPTEGIVHRIQDRRDRQRRERPFPPLPGQEEEEDRPERGRRAPPRNTDDEDAHRIDIHVLGLILPTGQLLPPDRSGTRLH
jgi:hypothetical protein